MIDDPAEGAAFGTLALDELRVADEADGDGVLGVFEGGIEAANGGAISPAHLEAEDVFDDGGEPIDEGAAAAEEDPEASAGKEIFAGELLFHFVEGLAKAHLDDLIEHFAVDLHAGETRVVFDVDGFTRLDSSGADGAVLELELFGFDHGELEDDADIIRNVVSPDADGARDTNRAFLVNDKIGGAGT